MNKRRCSSIVGFTILLFSLSLCAEEELTVVSWGGSYAKACIDGFFIPFEKETGIKVNVENYNGGLAPIRAQVESGNVFWDVVDVESHEDLIGCDEGLLEYLGDLELPDSPDGTSAEEDYFEHANSECGVGTIVWATITAYNSSNYETDPPTMISDFFDLEKYPGKRGMRRMPQVNLEFALMADGVPPEDVYDVLSTDEGIDRAFKKLDTIKDSLVFWEAGAQPPQLLADNEVAITTAYNGRIFNAINLEKQPFAIVWDGHVRDYGQLVIVAGSPNLENAKKFLQFAARSTSMVGISNRISYAPLRHSAWKLVGKHVDTHIEMKPHMPTAPQNSKHFLINDAKWWAEHQDDLFERFTAWLSR
ncbi:MAG: ABC transporter substrate-binding protein [Gammaproteobacteria bacterium]|nr:ABC transporter substrate-binding protein [Gammaproteobacteria bacterium]MYF01588.1 ABC transporter substrate-binding protein [Gammaproteobacteria bacterium]MYI77221.1 ABC transporter substrate-binding protein [Gammaproteobacteria bacterium]